MTHLKIEQGGTTEYVSTAVITKLYLCAKEIKDYEDDPNNNFSGDSLVSLKGTLSAPIGYRVLKEWLESTFNPDLHIILDNYAIPFEDPNMLTYLNSIGVGSNGMITEALAAAATVAANSLNTTVTKFNELRYFTNITSSKGGLSGVSSGYVRFYNWTALLEVDISNFTSLGHSSGYGYEDTFCGCTALTTVTASDKLVDIGRSAFLGCSNLTTISGLDGIITLHSSGCFYGCSSLTSNNFSNVRFKFGSGAGDSIFNGCSSLTSITLDSSVTTIPIRCFSECTNLATINGTSNVTTVREESSGWGVFRNCKALTSIDLSSCTSIGSRAFDGCTSLTSVDIDWDNITNHKVPSRCFKNCTNITNVGTNTDKIVDLEDAAFYGCSNLTSIDLSGVDWSLGNAKSRLEVGDAYNDQVGLFNLCPKLRSIGIHSIPYVTRLRMRSFDNVGIEGEFSFPNVLTLDQLWALSYCPNITKLSFPSLITVTKRNLHNTGDGTIRGCNGLKILDLGSLLQTLGLCTFSTYLPALQAVLINVATPPSIDAFSGLENDDKYNTKYKFFANANCKIYVPDAAVTTYQSTYPYSLFAADILPMSDYNEANILGTTT